MPRIVVISAVLAAVSVLTLPALAADRSADARDFAGYIADCKASPDERGLTGCVADQVGSRTSYLGDILIETSDSLTPAQGKLLDRSQKAFEAYRDATCRYQLSAHDEKTEFDQLFCTLRLTNQRIADVLEGVDFLDQSD